MNINSNEILNSDNEYDAACKEHEIPEDKKKKKKLPDVLLLLVNWQWIQMLLHDALVRIGEELIPGLQDVYSPLRVTQPKWQMTVGRLTLYW